MSEGPDIAPKVSSKTKGRRHNQAQKKFTKRLKQLQAEVKTVSRYSLSKDGFYKVALRGAFVKAFEFTEISWRPQSEKRDPIPFFLSAMLRGICEDIIALKFIGKLPHASRDDVIRSLMELQVRKATAEQAQFFKRVRPFQNVLRPPPPKAVDASMQRLDAIGAASGLWKTKGKLPSIEVMARAVRLQPLYDYMYRVTSAAVHFNPRMIFRSGWGTEDQGQTGELTPRNFSGYYEEFNRIYSIYLLSLMVRTFKSELKLSRNFVGAAADLMSEIDNVLRWPEAITFEEMNLRAPEKLMQAVLKFMHDQKREHRKELRRKRKVAISAKG